MSEFNPDVVVIDLSGGWVRVEITIKPAVSVDVDNAEVVDAEVVGAEAKVEGPEQLTPREIEVLRLIVGGHTNRQIGVILNISTRTVERHRANLMGKLGLRGRAKLVRYAREQGLV